MTSLNSRDPFSVLKIAPTTDEAVIRAAWRREAKKHHPDVGGSDEIMRELNEALHQALLQKSIDLFPESDVTTRTEQSQVRREHVTMMSRQVLHDRSSFTIDLLPVDSFEFVKLAGAFLGSIIDEECPYLVEFSLENADLVSPQSGWCRCELVPEAGGTMVHLTVGAESRPVSVEHIRDYLVHHINRLS